MNSHVKLTITLCTLALTVGCSKRFTPNRTNSQIAQYTEQVQDETTSADKDIIIDNEIMAQVPLQDTTMLDAVAIPKESEKYQSIFFSEEQSESISLPEYKNMEINDISLMLTEMGSKDFHYPAASTSYVTSPYGWRRGRMHAGVDLKVHTGDDIYAAFDGVVRIAKYYGAYGYCVVIRHYNGLETLYGHSSKLLVKVNDEVKAGQVIALGGSTGRSTGSHLHFEVRIGGNYINPGLVIDTQNHSLQDKNLYITRRSNRIFASNNDSAEEREADIIEELSIRYHIVRSGDVLSRIAANNRTTVSTLCRLNHISSRSTLRIGQRLIVRDGIRPTTSLTKQQTTLANNNSTPTPTSNSSSTSVYTVRRGDTLSKIASRCGTSVNTICQLNNITTRTTLQINQKLRVNGTVSSQNMLATSTYTVRRGDTLYEIAKRNGTSVSSLCSLNNISSRTTLRVGQKLALNGISGSQTGSSTTYTVRSGDTLSQIARNNNTTVRSICQLNNISTRTTLRIGQRLTIAKKTIS